MSISGGLEVEDVDLTVSRLGLARDALAGQVAVITGAGRGIGRAMALAFSRLGASVVIAEISDEGAETDRMVRTAGGAGLFVRTDVSRQEDVELLRRRTKDAFGEPGILVNNAILCPVGSVLETDLAVWDRVISVNLRGAFLTCKAFLAGMVERKQGTIVNMVSTDAIPFLCAYMASKQGLVGLTKSLAAEVGKDGVRVIAFGPGFVNTPGLRSGARELAPRLGMSEEEFLGLSFHRAYEGAMPPEDAAAAAAYLVVALAEEFHGEVVDGYTVLGRAGFLDGADGAQARGVHPRPVTTGGAVSAAPAGRREPGRAEDAARALSRALCLSGGLEEIIAQTDSEFGRLPAMFRPLARGGFKAKTGQSLEEWARTAASLTAQLDRAVRGTETPGQGATPIEELRAHYRELRRLLPRLIEYCQGVPGVTARFVKDPDVVRTVGEVAAERERLVRSLIAALDAVTDGRS